MNEFVEQFLLEARELIEQGTNDLLALEKGENGKQTIDALFRAFHTLKGAAGIVEFAAMGRALHAAEGALSEVRNETRKVSPTLIDDCLRCLDQVTRWLDEMEATGEPPPNAAAAADVIVAKFVGKAPDFNDSNSRINADPIWLGTLRKVHGSNFPGAGVALQPSEQVNPTGRRGCSRSRITTPVRNSTHDAQRCDDDPELQETTSVLFCSEGSLTQVSTSLEHAVSVSQETVRRP